MRRSIGGKWRSWEWGEDVAVGLWGSDRVRYTFTGEVGEEELTEFLEVTTHS